MALWGELGQQGGGSWEIEEWDGGRKIRKEKHKEGSSNWELCLTDQPASPLSPEPGEASCAG